MTRAAVLPSATWYGVGTPDAIISQLNTLPAGAPVNASMAASRLATHDSGSGWIATPFLCDSFIHNSTPVYPGAHHGLLGGSRRRHGIDEFAQHARNLARIDFVIATGADVVVLPGIDTIDASLVDTSLLGLRHSYYADNRTIISDLFYLLRGHSPRDRASLQRRQHKNGTYWEFRPAAR